MNRLLHVGNRFKSKFKKIDGTEFYGQLLEIPDTSRVTNFISVRRYLRTQPNTIIKPRDVIVAGTSTYVVAEHGTGFYVDPIYKHFKLFEVDTIVNWYRTREYIHPITGVSELRRDQLEDIVYLSTQPATSTRDSIGVPNEMKIVVTNAAIELGDKVGNYLVTKSDVELGVNILTVKEL